MSCPLGNILALPALPSQFRTGFLSKRQHGLQVRCTPESAASIRCECLPSGVWCQPRKNLWPQTSFSSRINHCSYRVSEQWCSVLVADEIVEDRAEVQENEQLTNLRVKHVLCLSNGHGEDTIGVSILKELMDVVGERGQEIGVEALPLVGVGSAYSENGIQIVGPSKPMPSGGFIYMDVLQLLGDIRAGLVSLTVEQWRAIVQWLDKTPDAVILAVGDIFPLALAWLASIHARRKHKRILEYAFIGTAKSEFYIQEDPGSNPSTRRRFHVESLLGGVYLPWERAIMADVNCRLVAPRDGLTAEVLKKTLPSHARAKVHDLGNPMMDGLESPGALNFLEKFEYGNCIILLPGSRAPEVYANWCLLLEASKEVSAKLYPKVMVYITPVVPSLEPGPFYDSLVKDGWEPCWDIPEHMHSCHAANATSKEEHRSRVELWPANNGLCILQFRKENSMMLLLRGGFIDASHWGETGIAMAGTGTEQLVGLGKPVFTLPGNGPQFTYAFAEAQSRLLGKSEPGSSYQSQAPLQHVHLTGTQVFLSSDPQSLAIMLSKVLADKDSLRIFAENGLKRMGSPGASRRITEEILNSMS